MTISDGGSYLEEYKQNTRRKADNTKLMHREDWQKVKALVR
jgi:hypothetical protein